VQNTVNACSTNSQKSFEIMLALRFLSLSVRDTRRREAMATVLTLDEVASYLRVDPSTIYRLLKRQEITAFKVGSDWRFNFESIDHWRSKPERGEVTEGL
jgi:excisionase family DNA binding protein